VPRSGPVQRAVAILDSSLSATNEEKVMHRKTKWIAGGVGAAALLATGAGVAAASGGGDDDATDTPISGPALDQASAAALAETGGGHVTGTEVDDEESYYEVEVTLDDGSQVDVQLDKSFNVVSSKHDNETEGADD
jgi:uncharacterized membrane protein YkoI